jgi:hypothetical protein
MSSEYQIRKPKDLTKINPNDFGELLWWSYQLGITVEKLVTLVQKYGIQTSEIVKQLKHRDQADQ